MNIDAGLALWQRNWRRGLPWCACAAVVLAVYELAQAPQLQSLRPHWPIESVGVSGELRQTPRGALEAVIAGSLADDFFSVDVDVLRDAALKLPWVTDATVRRVWPNRLDISVHEHVAVARWAEGGLVSDTGELFYPENGRGMDLLPVLAGPSGSHTQMLRRYRELATALAPLERRVVHTAVDARGNWQVRLDGGMRLVLGDEQLHLGEFAQSLRVALGDRLQHASRVDLRYANGFAVRWNASYQPDNSVSLARAERATR
jgi:cell division protein FtsQ